MAPAGILAGPTQRFVEADVEVIEPTVADTLVVIDLGGHEFTVRLEPEAALSPNQRVRFLSTCASWCASTRRRKG